MGKSDLVRDAVIAVSASFGFYLIGKWIFNRRSGNRSSRKSWVVFFPDRRMVCMNIVRTVCINSPAEWPTHCGNRYCTNFVHDLSTAFSRLVFAIATARRSIDVAIFAFTIAELAEILVLLHRYRSVRVRVLVNSDQRNASGSQVERLDEAGIPVRCNPPNSHYLHHKFLVIDQQCVITGSFNWTKTAVLGNHENAVCISEPRIVDAFQREFTSLWELYRDFAARR